MSWIGLRDSTEAVMQPSGLGCPDTGYCPDPDKLIEQGTLLIEFRHDPSDRPVNILRYARRDPTAAVVTLRSDPDGTLSLLMRQGARDALHILHLPPLLPSEPVCVQYLWDNGRRIGVLAAFLPDRGWHAASEISDPLPLCWRGATQIVADRGRSQTHPGLVLAAIADHLAPVGPQPCLTGEGEVRRGTGESCALGSVRPGDTILAADGRPAQVRWIGRADVLARGVNAPHLMRAPYFRVDPDLPVGGAAMLRLSGTEVEYLFGEAQVTVPVRHLGDGQAILPLVPPAGQPRRGPPPPAVQSYYHILLDRAVPLWLSGAAIETFDVAPMVADPVLHRWSLVGRLPIELLPRDRAEPCHRLRDYEAKTLRQMQAA